MYKIRITQISVIKDGSRINLKSDEIINDLEKFRSEIKETYQAEKILFCLEEIDEPKKQ